MSYLPDVVIYHGDCQDGFTAAWACYKMWGRWPEYVEGFYNKPEDVIKSCVNRHVFMVDFSLNRDDLDRARDVCKSLIILDHHKGAYEHLQYYPQIDFEKDFHRAETFEKLPEKKIMVGFDNERSGASITWSFLHPDRARPVLVNYVEDRDLWKFNLPGTKEICAWVASFEPTFENWDEADMVLSSEDYIETAAAIGVALQRQTITQLKAFLPQAMFGPMEIGGYDNVPCANLPRQWASEGGQMLLDMYPDAPFSVSCYVNGDKYIFSLRSRNDRVDVSEVARKYGGNGHRNAAGFHINRAEWLSRDRK